MADAAPSLGREVHFEVLTLSGTRWVIDSTARDEKEAILEAQEIMRQNRAAGVRVLKEIYNSSTQRSASRVVYEHIPARPERPSAPRPVPMQQGMPAMRPKSQPEPAFRGWPSLVGAEGEEGQLLWPYLFAFAVLTFSSAALWFVFM